MRISTTFLLLLWSITGFTAQQAVTETGDIVILNNDGTWAYENKDVAIDVETTVNTNKFIKPEESTFLLKSQRNKSSFWINPKKWIFTKGESDSEYTFQLKGKDLYGLAITEEIMVPLDSFADIALSNFKEVGTDGKIKKKEYRKVNGNKVLYVEITGSIEGISAQYSSYYYSDDSGSTQFVTYTAVNLIPKYKKEIDDFLNGLDIQ